MPNSQPRRSERHPSASTASLSSSDASPARSVTGFEDQANMLFRPPQDIPIGVVDNGVARTQLTPPQIPLVRPTWDEMFGVRSPRADRPHTSRRTSFTQSALTTAITGLEDPHPAGRYSPGPAHTPPPAYSPRPSRSREVLQSSRSGSQVHRPARPRLSSTPSSLYSAPGGDMHERHPDGYALSSVPSIPLRNPRRPGLARASPSREPDRSSSDRSSTLSLSELDSNSGWSGVTTLSGVSNFSTSSQYSGKSTRDTKAFEDGRIKVVRQRTMHRPCVDIEAREEPKVFRLKKYMRDEYRRMKLVKTQKSHFERDVVPPIKHIQQKLVMVGSTRGIFGRRIDDRSGDGGRQEQTRQERIFHR